MALQSMTGYGKAEESDATHTINVELKSVNNRFLDFQCRLPRELLHLESLLRKELGAFINRGSITCHVHYEIRGAAGAQIALNEPLFQAYTRLLQRMSSELGTPGSTNPIDLLKIPEMVITQSQSAESPEAIVEKVLPVFRKACAELVQMREREGADLTRELEKRIEGFYPALDQVEKLTPQRQAEYVAKMRERIAELLEGQPMAEDRVLTEIGIMAERLDVAEELVRLRSHLGHFLETLRNPTPGKKLGFLQQEMHREVNTLSNKSQYYDIQQICIGWKEDLEIVREQLANVE